jgi:hypothetical protein
MESSALIDEFLEGIMDRIFPILSFNVFEKNSRLYYKTFIFKHTACVATNTQFNFVFHEKTLDNII